MSFIKTTQNIYKLVIMLMIAISFTTIGAWKLYKPLNYIANGLTTKARVIHVETKKSRDPDSSRWIYSYHPTARFYWYQRAYDSKVIMSSSEYDYNSKGKVIEIRFLPETPHISIPKWPLSQLIVNGIFLLVGLIVFWMIYKEHRYKEPEYGEYEEAEETTPSNPNLIIKKQYAANKTRGVFIFLLGLCLGLISLGVFITYLLVTDQTVDEIPLPMYPVIYIPLIIFSYALAKHCFYHLIVSIDANTRQVTVTKKLFWSVVNNTYHFGDIQYVQTSAKKFFYKDSGYHVTTGGTERMQNATQHFFVYIKPYNTQPILFEHTTSSIKADNKTCKYAEIIGCRTLTLR